jgi:hypothetical protein
MNGFRNGTYYFNTIETNYNADSPAKKEAIRKQATELGLITEPVADEKFIRVLRRSFDPNDAVKTRNFKTLADFSSQAP